MDWFWDQIGAESPWSMSQFVGSCNPVFSAAALALMPHKLGGCEADSPAGPDDQREVADSISTIDGPPR